MSTDICALNGLVTIKNSLLTIIRASKDNIASIGNLIPQYGFLSSFCHITNVTR